MHESNALQFGGNYQNRTVIQNMVLENQIVIISMVSTDYNSGIATYIVMWVNVKGSANPFNNTT